MLSKTIKLVKGGLKNLSEKTVNTDKKIKKTNSNVIILVVLCAKFLITHTKYFLNRTILFHNNNPIHNPAVDLTLSTDETQVMSLPIPLIEINTNDLID